MKKIKAKIVADSKNSQGDRITTYLLTYPRFIHSELMTHRVFSRNSASSRAIPFKKMVQMVEENPFIPIAWQKDHKGMQGNEYYDYIKVFELTDDWLEARNNAVNLAKKLNKKSVTKQLCNRLLEPFMWHTVIVTATEWENFFKLRCPQYKGKVKTWRSWKDMLQEAKNDKTLDTKDYQKLANADSIYKLKNNTSQADIHIQAIAEIMWDCYNESKPKQLKAGEWHIPFGDTLVNHVEEDGLHTDSKIDLAGGYIGLFPDIDNIEDIPYDYQYDNWLQRQKLKISTARCARISYETFGNNPKIDYEADIKLHDILVKNGHASPLEHCARAMSKEEYDVNVRGKIKFADYEPWLTNIDEVGGWCNNFKGFIQYRALINI